MIEAAAFKWRHTAPRVVINHLLHPPHLFLAPPASIWFRPNGPLYPYAQADFQFPQNLIAVDML